MITVRAGRYGIVLRRSWIQTSRPTTVRHFLWFWFFKEARPDDIDKKQKFPMNTGLEYEGKVYRYWKQKEDHNVQRRPC